jgi:hypothetical protein
MDSWAPLKVYKCGLRPAELMPESIERFIEGHAFLRSCESAPSPPPPPSSDLLMGDGGGGEGGRRGGESYDRKKAWPSINHSVFSGQCFCLKVHKIEIFFGFDFEICIIFFISYVKILRFYKNTFLIRPLLGEIRFFHLV